MKTIIANSTTRSTDDDAANQYGNTPMNGIYLSIGWWKYIIIFYSQN
jgi:hypothetical protein